MAKKQNYAQETCTIEGGEEAVRKANKCAKNLGKATRELPKVNDDGSSECGFAEELYAKREETLDEAHGHLRTLDKYSRWAAEEIKHLKDNLTVILAGKEALHKDSPRNRFSDAEVKLAASCRKLVRLRESIKKVFKLLQKTIKEAYEKQFPGRIPRDNSYSPIVDFVDPASDTASSQNDVVLDDELGGIIAMGPIDGPDIR